MDISTGLGLVAGAAVVCLVILMGGDLHMFVSEHAFIVIFGGSFAATLIRFPLASFVHGVPLGAKFAFTLRRMSQRDLVDELAGLAEIARKQGPMGLEKVDIEDTFLAMACVTWPMAMTAPLSATISSGIATTFSPILTKVRKSIARSATARRPSA